MAKIVQKKFKWDAVDAPDLAGYRIYIMPGDTVDYSAPFVDVDKDVTELLLPPDSIEMGEGNYTLGVTPFDAEGNEADLFMVTHPFDLTPPPAVQFAEVVDA